MGGDNRIINCLHHIQGRVGGLFGHMVNIDDYAAFHHFFQQDDSVLVQAADIGMSSAYIGWIKRFHQVADARNMVNDGMTMHRPFTSSTNCYHTFSTSS